ncbi:MAG: DUF3152 domain-containing protein [Actinobacteria bacterium]|nr:DUF3152 domain-containing protein [Actinomycetota bacterium]
MTGVRVRLAALASVLATVAVGCGGAAPADRDVARAPARPATTIPTTTTAVDGVVEVRYRIERRVDDAATVGFADVVRATLTDPRGWVGAGFRLVEDPAAEYLVVLAEGGEVDELCFPYRTGARFSCQNGPVVAMNADRWRVATETWTGDRASYRQMLVNHEVGHLLGRHHPPEPQCPAPGRPAPVMAQQSTDLDGCLPNPWPLPEELSAAARHDEPLAPPYEKSTSG